MSFVMESFNFVYHTTIDFLSEVALTLQTYGWFFLGGSILIYYIYVQLQPAYRKWREQMDDAAYHRNPDRALAEMERIQQARERQQQELNAAAILYAEKQKQLVEKKRREAAERVQQGASGQKLGSLATDYLPLAGGGSMSSYKAPKKKCPGGGCGKS